MSSKKLGRGLDALLGDALTPVESASDNVRMLPVESLSPGVYQPRSGMDDDSLAELAESIQANGVIQPIIVRRKSRSGEYEIIAGERRWRASQRAAVTEVPAIVRDISDESALVISLIENIQRQDLNAVEEARALQRLKDDFSLTHEQIGQSVGKSRATITNQLRLLSLAPQALEHLSEGRIEAGHAKVLLSLKGKQQEAAAEIVISKSLSVRQTESLIKRMQTKRKTRRRSGGSEKDSDIAVLERELSDSLGAPVTITDRRGRGFVKIGYHNLDELEGIISKIHQSNGEGT